MPVGISRAACSSGQKAALDPDLGYHEALERFANWARYYNDERPHSALQYLCPRDYYRGDPDTRIAERKLKLATATADRTRYWNDRST